MMFVPVSSGRTFEPGIPQPLFDAPVPNLGISSDRNHYVVTADGQHFLVRRVLENRGPSIITAVLDWTAGLSGK